jgi:hypothetical protein
VSMRKWLHPEHPQLEDHVQVVYRQKELGEVMQRHDDEAVEVERFKTSQAKLGRPVEIEDIPTDGRPMESRGPAFEMVLVDDEAEKPAESGAEQPRLSEFEADLFGSQACAAAQDALEAQCAAGPTVEAREAKIRADRAAKRRVRRQARG